MLLIKIKDTELRLDGYFYPFRLDILPCLVLHRTDIYFTNVFYELSLSFLYWKVQIGLYINAPTVEESRRLIDEQHNQLSKNPSL